MAPPGLLWCAPEARRAPPRGGSGQSRAPSEPRGRVAGFVWQPFVLEARAGGARAGSGGAGAGTGAGRAPSSPPPSLREAPPRPRGRTRKGENAQVQGLVPGLLAVPVPAAAARSLHKVGGSSWGGGGSSATGAPGPRPHPSSPLARIVRHRWEVNVPSSPSGPDGGFCRELVTLAALSQARPHGSLVLRLPRPGGGAHWL